MNGQVSFQSVSTAVWLAIPAIIGVFIGKHTVGLVGERMFYRLIIFALFLVSVQLVGKAVLGADPLLLLLRP